MTIQHMSDYFYNNLSGPFKFAYNNTKKDIDKGAPVDVKLPLNDAGGDKDYTDFYDLDILGKAAHNPAIKVQKMTVNAKKNSVKATKLKKSKIIIKKPITIKNNKGKITYTLTSRSSKKISISKKGVITVKKGKYKKGTTLTLKVALRAAGNKDYLPTNKKATVKVKIK